MDCWPFLHLSMMVIDNKYELTQTVYLKTDPDQRQRIITQINVRVNGLIYELTCGSSGSWHYEFEITAEKDVLQATTQ
jgi:hypothetical protein